MSDSILIEEPSEDNPLGNLVLIKLGLCGLVQTNLNFSCNISTKLKIVSNILKACLQIVQDPRPQ